MTLNGGVGSILGVGEARLNGRSVLGYGANLILSHKFIDFRPEMVFTASYYQTLIVLVALTQPFHSFT